MEIEYSFDREIPVAQLKHLFAQTCWANDRTEKGLAVMLDGSFVTLGAWDGDKLVGFCRASGDGIYRAVIDDVIVDEPYRGQGIGSEMVRRLVERLAGIWEVTLGCDEELVGFYEKLGFRRPSWVCLLLQRSD